VTRPTRLVAITYGGLTIGVGTSYDLTAVHQIRESYGRFELEATVVIRGATSSAAQVLDAAFRSAFTKPDQSDFDVTINGVSWLSFSHSADSWLNPEASYESLEEFRTERSRAYRLRVESDMPADLSGRNGRRSSSVDVDVDQAGNLHLAVSAEYTALSGTSAYDQATAQFPTYVGTVQTAVGGGTWLPVHRTEVEYDDQNKVATIRATYVQDRTLTIAYGGVTVGTSTSYDLREIMEVSETYEQTTVVCLVTFDAADTASVQMLDDALRAAFTKPDQDLVVTLNGQTWLSLSHSGHTGFNARVQLVPLPEYFSTRSYGYRVTFQVRLPADLSGRAGRQTSRWSTSTRPTGQKLLAVEATYTALSGVGTALATAQADFATYVAALQAVVTGTWVETQAVSFDLDDQNKVCVARAEYQQRLIDDSLTGADDTTFEVRGYTISVERPESKVMRNSGALPLARVSVTFGADVDTGSTIKATYTDRILPYLAALITSHADVVGTPKVARESVEFDPWRNTLQGTVTYLAAQTSLISASKRIRGRENSGETLVPKLNRNEPFDKAQYTGPRYRIRTVEIVTIELFGGTRHDTLVRQAQRDLERQGYVWKDTETVEADTQVPTARGDSYTFTERATVLTLEFGKVSTGGAGAGRASGASYVPQRTGS